MLILCLSIRRFLHRTEKFEDLLRPLREKNLFALTDLPRETLRNFPGADAAESLTSLGNLLKTLRSFVSKSEEIQRLLNVEDRERKTLFDHIKELLEVIGPQFYEIEQSARQASGAMDSIGDYLHSLKDAAGGQALSIEGMEEQVSRTTAMVNSVAARMQENTGKAEALQNSILTSQEQVETLNNTIKNIARDVEQITELTAIINQISEQTNILSMNAAIESAHAGSAGAGFAVVAEEIKKLAELTRENAGKIREELSAISEKTRSALKTSEESARTFDAITGTVKLFAGDLAEISDAVLETSAAGGSIETSIHDSAAITRKIMDGATDIMAHHQSFRTALEQIRNLSEKTRTEIKEIHSGTQELLENTTETHKKFLESLEDTEDLKKIFPPTAANPETADETAAAAGRAAATDPAKQAAANENTATAGWAAITDPAKPPAATETAPTGDKKGENPALDERGIAVKQPPRTFI
jgi:methyl-accepting chemotaxis protein